MNNKYPLRFGIIGCSSVAKRRFLPALLKSPLAKLEHIGSRSSTKAKEYASSFQCSKVGSYMEVMEDQCVDAIYISTPVTLHVNWLREAVKHGKHILCDKPAFNNLQSAIDIVKLCSNNGVRLMEGYMFQYHPQHSIVKKLIEENKIGISKFFTAEYMIPRPDPNNIRFNPELGGGCFLDTVGYLPMASSLQISSPPESVYCEKRIDPLTQVDDTVAMLVNYSNGIFGHFSSGYGLQHRSQYSLHGTLGRIEVHKAYAVNSDTVTNVSLETNSGIQYISADPTDQFLLMINDFVTQIENKSGDFEKSLLNQHIFMEAARRSANEHRLVSLNEFII